MNRLARIGTQLIQGYFPELQKKTLNFFIQRTEHKGMTFIPGKVEGFYFICADPRAIILPEKIVIYI